MNFCLGQGWEGDSLCVDRIVEEERELWGMSMHRGNKDLGECRPEALSLWSALDLSRDPERDVESPLWARSVQLAATSAVAWVSQLRKKSYALGFMLFFVLKFSITLNKGLCILT